jgi:hypothetical protein
VRPVAAITQFKNLLQSWSGFGLRPRAARFAGFFFFYLARARPQLAIALVRRRSGGMIVGVEASSASKCTVCVGAPAQNRFASFCWMLLYFCHRPVCEMQKNK